MERVGVYFPSMCGMCMGRRSKLHLDVNNLVRAIEGVFGSLTYPI